MNVNKHTVKKSLEGKNLPHNDTDKMHNAPSPILKREEVKIKLK